MKTIGGAFILLALAIGFWSLALSDSVPGTSGSTASVPGLVAGTAPPHPVADSLALRRVLAQADGLHVPSPDGTMIGFVEASGDVAVRYLESGGVRTLTEAGALDAGGHFAYGLAFSPDGQRLAYLWTDGFREWSVQLVDVETKDARELVPDRETVEYLHIDPGSWSPDGTSLAVTLYLADGSRRLVVVPVEGGEPELLRSFDWRAPGNLAFSPDGAWIAYDVPREEGSLVHDIYLLAMDGSREVPLLRTSARDRVAGWMPGGGAFFYLSGDQNRSDLMAVEVVDGRIVAGPWRIKTDLVDPWPRGFTDDAFFLVQMPERRMAYTAVLDPDEGAISGPLRPLDPGRTMEWPMMMAWSPDGDRVAYLAGRERPHLVVRSRASGAERVMEAPFNVFYTQLEWSPTEDRLLVGGTDSRGRAGVHLLELDDGSVELVLRTERDRLRYGHPRWSPGGDAIYVSRLHLPDDRQDIVRVDLETLEERKVFAGSHVAALAVAPDGSRLAVALMTEDQANFRVLSVPLTPATDRETRELASFLRPDEGQEGSAGLDWTPDGRHLVIGSPWRAQGADSDQRSLWIVDADGSHLQELSSFVSTGGSAVRPRVHPGGREIAFIAGENRWELWALGNLSAGLFVQQEDLGSSDRR